MTRDLLLVPAGAALVGFAWWEGGEPWPSLGARASVLPVICAAFVLAVAAGRHRQQQSTALWARSAVRAVAGWRRHTAYAAGVVVWTALILAFMGWDANSFAHQTHDLPTLSYLFGRVTRFWWGRSLVFLGWVLLGCWLATGRRVTRRSDPGSGAEK